MLYKCTCSSHIGGKKVDISRAAVQYYLTILIIEERVDVLIESNSKLRYCDLRQWVLWQYWYNHYLGRFCVLSHSSSLLNHKKNSTQWSEPSIKSRYRSLVMSFSAATVVQQYLTYNGNTLPWSHCFSVCNRIKHWNLEQWLTNRCIGALKTGGRY